MLMLNKFKSLLSKKFGHTYLKQSLLFALTSATVLLQLAAIFHSASTFLCISDYFMIADTRRSLGWCLAHPDGVRTAGAGDGKLIRAAQARIEDSPLGARLLCGRWSYGHVM